MKVAYLSASKIPSNEANSVHVMKMTEAFLLNGTEIDLYARSQSKSVNVQEYYNVKKFDIIHSAWPKIPGLGGWIYALISYLKIRKRKYSFFFGRDKYTLFFVKLLGAKPYVYESHSIPQGFITRYIERYLTTGKHFKKLICISSQLKEDYLQLFPQLKEKILVLHDAATLPHSIPESPGVNNIGYVGHLYDGRGIDLIISIAKQLPNCQFHMVGGEVADVARWKKISPANIIYYGHISNGKLSEYYSKFTICLAPYQTKVTVQGKGDTSRWMSPLKIFEYMANKKVILSSNIKVLCEVLETDVNCIMLEPNDTSQWVEAIVKLQQNAQLAEKLATNAHQYFLENHTWESRAKKVISIYTERDQRK